MIIISPDYHHTSIAAVLQPTKVRGEENGFRFESCEIPAVCRIKTLLQWMEMQP